MVRVLLALALVVGAAAVLGRHSHAQTTGAYHVIVNAKNPVTSLEKRFVSDAFLRKRTQWSRELVIKPVDLGAKHATRARFSQVIHGRSPAAVRRYWAQLVFSGAGIAPPVLSTDGAVVEYVGKHAGAIGYVSTTAVLGPTTKIVQVK